MFIRRRIGRPVMARGEIIPGSRFRFPTSRRTVPSRTVRYPVPFRSAPLPPSPLFPFRASPSGEILRVRS